MRTVPRPSPNGQSERPSQAHEPQRYARLELVINDQTFKVCLTHLGLLGEFKSWRLRDEPSGKKHVVTQDLDGFTACTCAPFVGRRNPQFRCDHILALFAVGLLDENGGIE
jgi:hypothetical protein